MIVIEVVYIAYCDYGLDPVRRFLKSYGRFVAGRPHLLTIAIKGTCTAAERQELSLLCDVAGARQVTVPDEGFDIGTYLHLAAGSRADLMCLFNTNSVILGEGWLGKLADALMRQPDAGAVAATGSWESLASDERAVARRQGINPIREWGRFLRRWRHFPVFPNPHLRTNGLLIGKERLLNARAVAPVSKEQAFRFESGRHGLSRQLLRQGFCLHVVGRDGRAFAPDRWAASGTLWQADQENLLIGDNQTLRYHAGDAALRTSLHALAWCSPLQGRGGRVTLPDVASPA